MIGFSLVFLEYQNISHFSWTTDRMYRVYRNASDILESTLDTVWTWTADRVYRMFIASDIRRLHCVPNMKLRASLAAAHTIYLDLVKQYICWGFTHEPPGICWGFTHEPADMIGWGFTHVPLGIVSWGFGRVGKVRLF